MTTTVKKLPLLVHKAREWIDRYGVYQVESLCKRTGRLAESLDDVTCPICVEEYAKRKGVL
jgi:hypothetical protein